MNETLNSEYAHNKATFQILNTSDLSKLVQNTRRIYGAHCTCTSGNSRRKDKRSSCVTFSGGKDTFFFPDSRENVPNQPVFAKYQLNQILKLKFDHQPSTFLIC